MVKFIWHNGEVPATLKVKQVYGLLFTKDGRMLVRIENAPSGKNYSLAGGTPEAYDKDLEATLRREVIEEVNTKIDKPIMVGYQEVVLDDGKSFAQARMVALIKEIGEKLPDPDNGEIYERLLTTPEKAIDYINWGEVGKKQILEAKRLAQEKLGLSEFSDVEEYV